MRLVTPYQVQEQIYSQDKLEIQFLFMNKQETMAVSVFME